MSVTLTDSKGCLKTGMRADILRTSLETKSILYEKGTIYIGTGSTVLLFAEDSETDIEGKRKIIEIKIGKTSFVPRGRNSDTVLTFNRTPWTRLDYQKIGPDTVIKGNYEIKVDEAEEINSADYAKVADYVAYAIDTSGRNYISIERLSDLNFKTIGSGARMDLSYDGYVVGGVQILNGSQMGNYKEVPLFFQLFNTANLNSFYRHGGTITGRLWTDSSTHDFPDSITGFFPSGVITGSSFKQRLALKYTISNNGTISITCSHPFPKNIGAPSVTDGVINLRFRMLDAN